MNSGKIVAGGWTETSKVLQEVLADLKSAPNHSGKRLNFLLTYLLTGALGDNRRSNYMFYVNYVSIN